MAISDLQYLLNSLPSINTLLGPQSKTSYHLRQNEKLLSCCNTALSQYNNALYITCYISSSIYNHHPVTEYYCHHYFVDKETDKELK